LKVRSFREEEKRGGDALCVKGEKCSPDEAVPSKGRGREGSPFPFEGGKKNNSCG